MSTQSQRAPAVNAAIKIVECIANAGSPLCLAEINSQTAINKNMITRTLSELVDAGWVTYFADTGKYSLSLQLFRLGSTALQQKTLTACAGSYLKRLSDLSKECVQLAVPYDGCVVYIDQIEPKKDAGIRGRIGASYPLNSTAPGKIFKAFLQNDPALADIRKQGYALDREEYGRGVICIAAPVFDYTDNVIAAINIASLTVNQTADDLIAHYANALIDEASALSRELGCAPNFNKYFTEQEDHTNDIH